MGTRSMIGIENPNTGVVKSVYCHWDGYLQHNGSILNKHYTASPKVNNLIALGDLSSLRPEIGEKHAFSQFGTDMTSEAYDALYGEMCTFYGRDRGESGTEWKVAHTFDEFLNQVNDCCGEYYYIMKDGVWYCGDTYGRTELSNKLTALTEALSSEKEVA